MKKKFWIYDIEIYPNYFLVCFEDRDSTERQYFEFRGKDFEFDKRVFFALQDFINTQVCGLIGFNNCRFDYQILHYIFNMKTTDCSKIFEHGQKVIKKGDKEKGKHIDVYIVPEHKMKIPQLDLYLLNHFNNKARLQSLKGIEVFLRMANVQTLPYRFDTFLINSQMDEVRDYCWNDIEATKKFYFFCKDLIDLRIDLTKAYGINLMNKSNTDIGFNIFKKYYTEKTNIQFSQIKDLRDDDRNFTMGSIISDKISFETEYLQKFLEEIKSFPVTFEEDSNRDEKDDSLMNRKLYIKGCEISFAKGGIHSVNENMIVEADDEYDLIDFDWALAKIIWCP